MPVFLRPYKRALNRKLQLYRLNGVTADGFGRIRIVWQREVICKKEIRML